jgi:predicted glycoside hydrolase/deacetylase ChbG (UPF0249 family)
VALAAQTASAARRLWLVADDYGISRAVNAAIRDLLARGAINATSVMVVASGCNNAEVRALAALRAERPIATGLHLTLTAPFRPLTERYRPARDGAFLSLRTTLARALLRQLDARTLAAEIAAQIARFAEGFGRLPDFIDGHQHVQLFPVIAECLLEEAQRTVPGAWIRQCSGPAGSLNDLKAIVLDLLSRRLRRRARAMGLHTNPAFAGTYAFHDRADFSQLFPRFLRDLPDGSVIMCHPGMVDSELVSNDSLTSLREREYAFFKSDAYRGLLAQRGYTLQFQPD